MVPGVIGYIPEYREVIGTPREFNGPTWALVEKRRAARAGRAPP